MPKYTFRVQAQGGKFLADDIGGAHVVIHDAITGEQLAQGVTHGDSGDLMAFGQISTNQIAIASKNVVSVAAGTSSWWLVPDAGSSAFQAEIDVPAPRAVKVLVSGPVGGLQSAAPLRTQLVLSPTEPPPLPNTGGVALGHVIELPGLLVQPVTPLIHTAVAKGGTLTFTAKVTMMCGCQIAPTPNPGQPAVPWPAGDFLVQTYIQKVVNGRLESAGAPLGMTLVNSSQLPSTFSSATYTVPSGGSGTDYYQATIAAYQKGTGNAGRAIVNFYAS